MIWDQVFLKATITDDGVTAPISVEHSRLMDESSFERFYRTTSRPLWVYICRMMGDAALADDILQESYFRFLRVSAVAMDDAHMKSYLYKIATNLINDHWRSQKRENKDAIVSEISQSASAETSDVSQALQEMTAQQRSLLWLAYVEGNEHKEIAHILGLKEKSIRVLLFRARRKLAELLSQRGINLRKEL